MNADKTNAERSPLDSESRALTPSRAAPVTKRKAGAQPGNKHASRLNAKVRAVVALRIAEPELSIEAACKRIGCPESTYYKAQNSQAFEAHLASLLKGRVRSALVLKAFATYEGLHDAKSEYTREAVSVRTLQEAGVLYRDERGAVQPTSASISIVINAPQRSIGAASVQLDAQPGKDDDKSEG